MDGRIDLSVVVPVLNEEDNVEPLYQAVADALQGTPWSFELLFVDDGSTDATVDRLRAIVARDGRVRVVRLSRNFGQTAATAAGFHHARGAVLVTMDGDLQNDPADIPTLMRLIGEGYDVVTGWRRNRQDHLWSRKVPSRVANRLLAWVTGVWIRDTGCGLKAYRAGVIRGLPLYSDMHRFLPALVSVTGARIAQVAVNHRARRFGQSKYGLSRTFKVAADMLALKAILLTGRGSSALFHAPALAAGILSGLLLTAGFFDGDAEPAFMLLASGLLAAATAAFLATLGVLTQLVQASGDFRIGEFLSETERTVDHEQRTLLGRLADGPGPRHGTGTGDRGVDPRVPARP
ncbi:MAG TPA: glycosyltransferase family 2 protein [Azospirillum sp.]|nr:glycosyltransferase family 2 protein [Azospirillum sp.]